MLSIIPKPATVSQIGILRQCNLIQKSSLHLSAVMNTKRAGRHKPTKRRDKPLTYEEANKPDQIGVRKSFNSLNTTGLVNNLRAAETSHEDLFIRKFVHGTWPRLLASDVIIKRRANQIIVSFMAIRMTAPTKFYFLIGYTEEILSYVLKCIVKLEIQTIEDRSDLTYKYI